VQTVVANRPSIERRREKEEARWVAVGEKEERERETHLPGPWRGCPPLNIASPAAQKRLASPSRWRCCRRTRWRVTVCTVHDNTITNDEHDGPPRRRRCEAREGPTRHLDKWCLLTRRALRDRWCSWWSRWVVVYGYSVLSSLSSQSLPPRLPVAVTSISSDGSLTKFPFSFDRARITIGSFARERPSHCCCCCSTSSFFLLLLLLFLLFLRRRCCCSCRCRHDLSLAFDRSSYRYLLS